MDEYLIDFLNFCGKACWVEIVTEDPRCIYYFGPFLSKKYAHSVKAGYVEDLENEGATGIRVTVKRCKPDKLTIFDEEEEQTERKRISTFSGQPS
ncbi:MAG: hypothetical protein BRC47_02145 [Cyanobacteria bacterium QS_7_48_42]|jgi:hypothetical protein|nr:MAG: hypothetical protein BRC34_03005 [Cyanobacteria bacterium QH_1_48_107]PSO61270.1 MAG: hypothetical protein BRC35_00310 [Cyanobacteria bacterium QH_10_48_56]PSO63103.1 MAG: hypothetical protein BRC39_05050 [Cyanobacteria bacterium QH_7_48_89]PSO64986.1 MAG: hypothetical protein BRC38_10280 [Cyanobacteria bacterium QH_6_48_35]PSO65970.1 MAG: hypothetical protein BRC36_02570 [Cyanobacteria bacterium QH_2_48_84]PSO70697.1 MAG: hypothetical protein BRC42_09395 [Cyanobacteria bacterium QS_1_